MCIRDRYPQVHDFYELVLVMSGRLELLVGDASRMLSVGALILIQMCIRDRDYIQESVRQFLVHLKYLTDTSTGLFFHGFTFVGRHHYAGALWGRGNAWYTAGLVDYLDMVTLSDGVKTVSYTHLDVYKRQRLSIRFG